MTAAEDMAPPAAQPPVLRVRRRNIVFVTIMLGVLLEALDRTIVGYGAADDRLGPGRRRAWSSRRPGR